MVNEIILYYDAQSKKTSNHVSFFAWDNLKGDGNLKQ
jgi:hypothetical protein